ncbi:5909_t:CDS:1, partial [Racocetra fulgida]
SKARTSTPNITSTPTASFSLSYEHLNSPSQLTNTTSITTTSFSLSYESHLSDSQPTNTNYSTFPLLL